MTLIIFVLFFSLLMFLVGISTAFVLAVDVVVVVVVVVVSSPLLSNKLMI